MRFRSTRVSLDQTTARGTLHSPRVAVTISYLVVVAVCGLVYARVHARTATANNAVNLPAHVAETRDLILAAVRSASIDDIAAVVSSDDARPDLGIITGRDSITALKKMSADGQGREILGLRGAVLDVAPATLPLRNDLENNLMYVWPYLAEKPIERLSPREEVDLYRLAPSAKVAEMREKNAGCGGGLK